MPTSEGSCSTSGRSRKSGVIIADALQHPVTIPRRNSPRLVILNIEDDEKLVTRSETRTSGTIATMPDELFQEFERAVDAYARDDETSGP